MLLLAVAELIFFTVASMGPRFGFGLKYPFHIFENIKMFLLMLSSTFTAFSSSCTAALARNLGVHGNLGGDTALSPADQRGIPDHVTSHSAYKADGN